MCNISRFFHALKEQTVGEICLVELSLRTKRLPGMEINLLKATNYENSQKEKLTQLPSIVGFFKIQNEKFDLGR